MKTVLTANRLLLVGLIILGLLAMLLSRSLFIVRLDQFAIVTQFGKPVRTIEQPGLYARIPFVQMAQYLDKRIMEWDDNPQEMITNDKKRIYINTFARWRVSDPLKFFTVVKTESVAQLNLDKVLGSRVRDVVSAHKLDEVVRDTNRELSYATDVSVKERKTIEIAEGSGRTNLMRIAQEKSTEELRESFGIELVDIQIKQINYTESARRETINEMISERMVVVERYEAEGEEESEKIRGQIEETLQQLQAEANQRKLELEGEGLAKAIEYKSAAFGKNPEFFQFLETLRLYEESFDENTTLVLGSDQPLLKLLGTPPVP